MEGDKEEGREEEKDGGRRGRREVTINFHLTCSYSCEGHG